MTPRRSGLVVIGAALAGHALYLADAWRNRTVVPRPGDLASVAAQAADNARTAFAFDAARAVVTVAAAACLLADLRRSWIAALAAATLGLLFAQQLTSHAGALYEPFPYHAALVTLWTYAALSASPPQATPVLRVGALAVCAAVLAWCAFVVPLHGSTDMRVYPDPLPRWEVVAAIAFGAPLVSGVGLALQRPWVAAAGAALLIVTGLFAGSPWSAVPMLAAAWVTVAASAQNRESRPAR